MAQPLLPGEAASADTARPAAAAACGVFFSVSGCFTHVPMDTYSDWGSYQASRKKRPGHWWCFFVEKWSPLFRLVENGKQLETAAFFFEKHPPKCTLFWGWMPKNGLVLRGNQKEPPFERTPPFLTKAHVRTYES